MEIGTHAIQREQCLTTPPFIGNAGIMPKAVELTAGYEKKMFTDLTYVEQRMFPAQELVSCKRKTEKTRQCNTDKYFMVDTGLCPYREDIKDI